MYRSATASELELLALRCGEIHVNEIAQTLVCCRCPMATDCCVAYNPEREYRHLAPRGCLIRTPEPAAA